VTLVVALILAASPASARCTELEALAADASPAELQALLASVPLPTLPSGRPGRWPALAAAVDALRVHPDPDALKSSREALSATCAQLAREPVPAVAVDPEGLARILAEPQFAGRSGQAWALERLLSRALDLLKELLQERGFRSFSMVGRDLFLVAVLGLLAVGGWRVLRKRRTAQRALSEPSLAAQGTRTASEVALAQAAVLALAQGQPREALRHAMHAVVTALGGRGLIDRRGTATNRELARSLDRVATPAQAELLRSLAQRFDDSIYGEQPVDLLFARRFVTDAQSLRAALPEPR
jgi:hypothetical protein